MRIREVRYVPYPVAWKLLDKVRRELQSLPFQQELLLPQSVDIVVNRTRRYLEQFSKCTAEAAEKAAKRIMEETGLNEFVAVMLVNIRPKIPEEAMDIIRIALRTAVEPEKAARVIEILDEECGK